MAGEILANPLTFVPGTQFWYSNANFVVATYFVEKYSGLSFGEYVRSKIVEPLGLNGTSFDAFDGQLGKLDPLRTRGYYKFYDEGTGAALGTGAVTLELNAATTNGAGGITSTAADVERLWRVLFDPTTKGAPLLKDPRSQAAILAPRVTYAVTSPLMDDGSTTWYFYYAQGTVVVCVEEGCSDDGARWPRYVFYQGGTFATHTANVLSFDRTTNKPDVMAQTWTSSVQALTTEAQLDAANKAQAGRAIGFVQQWTATAPVNAELLMWDLLRRFASTGSTEENKANEPTSSSNSKKGASSSSSSLRGVLIFAAVAVLLLSTLVLYVRWERRMQRESVVTKRIALTGDVPSSSSSQSPYAALRDHQEVP